MKGTYHPRENESVNRKLPRQTKIVNHQLISHHHRNKNLNLVEKKLQNRKQRKKMKEPETGQDGMALKVLISGEPSLENMTVLSSFETYIALIKGTESQVLPYFPPSCVV